ncbi:MAG TPA: DinB family protein [Thermoanaerobaculia bacterium]|nr:DinB family protein [Thermoanaerobaculia bacterium]
MPFDELQTFLELWDREAKTTAELLRALPAGQYDFRPDAGGRSLGELAWHLAEGDAYMSSGVEAGSFQGLKPHGIERPRAIDALYSS